ncbi:MAG: AMP-binding protein, partial [Myxococcota bacterium]
MPDLWHHRVGSTPDLDALRHRVDGQWRAMTWSEAGARVRAIANGLLATGLAREQRCIVMSDTCVEWILADFAILCAGGATTTVYPAASDREVEFIVGDSQAVIAFVDGPAQVARLRTMRANLPALIRVVVFRDGGAPTDPGHVVGGPHPGQVVGGPHPGHVVGGPHPGHVVGG